MQYVGQTCRALQKRFGEHYRRMKKPKPIDTFLYQHFKRTGHSPNDVLVQPVEKLTYDKNSSSRFKIIKRHETELKWIKLLQTPFPLGFNDNIYHEGNISKMPDFDVFSLLEIRKRKSRSHGIRKKGNGKRKKRAVKRSNTSLKDLSKVLEDHGRHSMLSFLSSLPISVLLILDTEANKFYDRNHQLFGHDCELCLLGQQYQRKHFSCPMLCIRYYINHIRLQWVTELATDWPISVFKALPLMI